MRPSASWAADPKASAARRPSSGSVEYGPNELAEAGVKSPWRILAEQFTSLLIIILIIAAVVSAFLGDYEDAIVIMAIVVLNGALGFRQEYKAEKTMSALRKLAAPMVRVRRAGEVTEVPAADLVPGDVVLLEAGQRHTRRCQAHPVGQPARPGGRPHRRIRAGGEDRRTSRPTGRPPGRPREHALHGHLRLVRAGRGRDRRHRHGHRTGQDRRHDPEAWSASPPRCRSGWGSSAAGWRSPRSSW